MRACWRAHARAHARAPAWYRLTCLWRLAEKVKESYYSSTEVLACGDNTYGQLGLARKLGESMGKERVQQVRYVAVALAVFMLLHPG